jgi:hypothetical protein
MAAMRRLPPAAPIRENALDGEFIADFFSDRVCHARAKDYLCGVAPRRNGGRFCSIASTAPRR